MPIVQRLLRPLIQCWQLNSCASCVISATITPPKELVPRRSRRNFLSMHAQEAQQHADRIAERIVELNGQPDFNPETLTGRSLSQYTNARSLHEMIKEDLVAERIAVESYSEVVRWLAENDVTTRKLMADILMVEEQHAADMQKLLGKIQPV